MLTLEHLLEAAVVCRVPCLPCVRTPETKEPVSPHSSMIRLPLSGYSQPLTDCCLAQVRGSVIKTHLLPL